VVIWCADQDPKAEIDIQDPRVWAEANPNFPISPVQDYMVKAAREAAQLTSRENDFRRYHLNIWVGQAERWISPPAWAACSSGPDRWLEMEDELAGYECFVGLDLASTRDLVCEALVFPPQGSLEVWAWLYRFWWPAVNVRLFAAKTRVPVESWVKMGALIETPGNAADHGAVEEQVIQDCSRFRVLKVGIDVMNAHSVATHLTDQNVPVELVRFGMLSMTTPSKTFERLILRQEMDHGGHPVMRWNVGNCAIRRDKNDNYMPCKQSSKGKIDGVAASVVALAMAGMAPGQSYLAMGDLVVLS
jgi:phage terminase large subunit-like protein